MKKIDEYSIVELKELSEDNVLNLIREKLKFDREIGYQLKNYQEGKNFDEEHRRFDMSGYESETGNCTVHNINILNEFANLGIYDYTKYLFLDFYKGTSTIYLKYWGTDEYYEDDFGGSTTSEIIYTIFKLTIFKDGEISSRRRF